MVILNSVKDIQFNRNIIYIPLKDNAGVANIYDLYNPGSSGDRPLAVSIIVLQFRTTRPIPPNRRSCGVAHSRCVQIVLF